MCIPLIEEMATLYSCPERFMDRGAWRATVMGSQRAGHDWVFTLYFFTLHHSIRLFTTVL